MAAPNRSFAFRIYLRQVGPLGDPDWRVASPEVRKQLLRAVVVFGLEEKDRDLAQGLDKEGNPLTPISRYTRTHRKSAMGPASPGAPPLTPSYGLSRTRSLLDGRAMADHAEFFWRWDEHTQKPWSRTLEYHRRGGGRLPVRDVIGVSPDMIARVRERTLAWWRAYKRAARLRYAGADALRFAWEEVLRLFGAEPSVARFVAKQQGAGNPNGKIVRPPAPKAIPLVGRTDIENSTRGFGASDDRDLRAFAAGTSTGYRIIGPAKPGGFRFSNSVRPPRRKAN